MSYTLSWKDPTGQLHEQSLGLSDLLAALPRLQARATVVGERGEVCGEILERLSSDLPSQRWLWRLRLSSDA